MEKTSFSSTILVEQDPSVAFEAVTNFKGWWSEEVEGDTSKLDEAFFYHHKDVHLCKGKLVEKIKDQKLVYLIRDNQFDFVNDNSEWKNTKLVFEMSREGEKTKVIFTHEGLNPDFECYGVCSNAWSGYIQGSLKNLINTGKGKPNPKEGGLNDELVKNWGLPDK